METSLVIITLGVFLIFGILFIIVIRMIMRSDQETELNMDIRKGQLTIKKSKKRKPG